jgi:hypothetical protein
MSLHQSLSGNGFQRRTLPLPLGSRALPVAQLQTSNNNSSQWLYHSSPRTHSLTHSLTNPLHFSPLQCTALTVLNSVEWHSLGEDYTKNPTSNSTSIVARMPLPKNGSSTVAYLRSCYIAMDVVCFLFQGRCIETGLYATISFFLLQCKKFANTNRKQHAFT